METHSSPIDLRALWEVLDGQAPPSLSHPAAQLKTMRLVPTGPADLLVLTDQFAIRSNNGSGVYLPSIATTVVHALMQRAGVTKVAESALATLPTSESSDPDVLIWFRRAADGLDIRIRETTSDQESPASPTTIPSEGPSTFPKAYRSRYLSPHRHFAEALTCRHCEAAATRFVQLPDALQCEACGLRMSPRTNRGE